MDADAWVSLASGLAGTIIGAVTSWFVTKSSVEREHQNQKELVKIQEDKNNLIALKSVLSEVGYNLVCLNSVDKIIKNLKIDFINYKESGFISPIKNNKWDKHSDVLESLLTPKQINLLDTFYINLAVELNIQAFNSERLKKLMDAALDCRTMLKEVVNDCEAKL